MNADLKRGRRAPLLFIAILASLLVGCSLCGDENVLNVPAPDRKLTASTFVRNCGATADYSTWVTLHGPSDKFNRSEDLVFTAKGDHSIELTWKDAEHLVVDCRNCNEDEVVLRTTKRWNIEIKYPR
jgi:hypothetical protein